MRLRKHEIQQPREFDSLLALADTMKIFLTEQSSKALIILAVAEFKGGVSIVPIQGLELFYVMVIYIGEIYLISKLPFIGAQQ